MARLKSIGFELNSTTANVELTATTGSPSIQSTTKRNGTYAMQINSLSSATPKGALYQFASSTGDGPYYARFYFRYATAPSGDNYIAGFYASTTVFTPTTGIKLTSSGALGLYNSGIQVGSNTSALSANTWYRIELLHNGTGVGSTDTLTLRIDGVDAVTSSALSLSPVESFEWGGNLGSELNTSGNWYFDDIAINDTTGSYQTSWPGEGGIVVLRPNGAGDNTQWTPLAGSNYTNVDEVTPDGVTSYVWSATSGQIDDYAIDDTPSAIATDDVINVVHVETQFAISSTTSTDPDAVVRFKKASSGTVSESSNISGSGSTSYNVNKLSNPRTPPLTLYQNPDGTTITKSTLDTSQIGIRETVTDTHNIRISALWLTVDYAGAPTVALSSPADAATGQSTTPALTFTGTDPEALDLRYNVQIGTDSVISGLLDSYSESNQDLSQAVYAASINQMGQSFQGNGGKITSVKFYLSKTGSPTGNLTAYLYAHSGTYGSSSVATGAALATSATVDITTLSTSLALVEFTFSSPYTTTNGTYYVVAVEYTGGDNSNRLNVGLDNSSPSHAGNLTRYQAGWSSISGQDLIFYVYSQSSTLLDKVSGTDAGFSGSPDNSDPFASGQAVTYTVQAGDTLTAGTTYYWRVRAKDVNGTGAYGAWSSTRSFTTTGGTTTSTSTSTSSTSSSSSTSSTSSSSSTSSTSSSTSSTSSSSSTSSTSSSSSTSTSSTSSSSSTSSTSSSTSSTSSSSSTSSTSSSSSTSSTSSSTSSTSSSSSTSSTSSSTSSTSSSSTSTSVTETTTSTSSTSSSSSTSSTSSSSSTSSTSSSSSSSTSSTSSSSSTSSTSSSTSSTSSSSSTSSTSSSSSTSSTSSSSSTSSTSSSTSSTSSSSSTSSTSSSTSSTSSSSSSTSSTSSSTSSTSSSTSSTSSSSSTSTSTTTTLPIDTYYFDASDAGPTDSSSYWTNDANAFNGSISDYASSTTNSGGAGLNAEGTNAPASGGVITQVRARAYGSSTGDGTDGITIRIYEDGGVNQRGFFSITSNTPGYTGYTTLSAPSGGWTWDKVAALEVTAQFFADIFATEGRLYIVEIEVTHEAATTTSTTSSSTSSTSSSSSSTSSTSSSTSSTSSSSSTSSTSSSTSSTSSSSSTSSTSSSSSTSSTSSSTSSTSSSSSTSSTSSSTSSTSSSSSTSSTSSSTSSTSSSSSTSSTSSSSSTSSTSSSTSSTSSSSSTSSTSSSTSSTSSSSSTSSTSSSSSTSSTSSSTSSTSSSSSTSSTSSSTSSTSSSSSTSSTSSSTSSTSSSTSSTSSSSSTSSTSSSTSSTSSSSSTSTTTTLPSLDVKDYSPNGNDLTNVNVVASTDVPSALTGATQSAEFSKASAGWLTISDAAQTGIEFTTTFTFEFWAKFKTTNDFMGLIWKNNNPSTQEFSLAVASSLFSGEVYNSSGQGTVSNGPTPATNEWHHWAFTCDVSNGVSTTWEFYKDGVSQGNGSASGIDISSINNSNTAFVIGDAIYDNSIGNVGPLDGYLTDIRIWNDIRTSTEIANNYQTRLSGNEAGLVAYYPFESSLGTTTSTSSTSSSTSTSSTSSSSSTSSTSSSSSTSSTSSSSSTSSTSSSTSSTSSSSSTSSTSSSSSTSSTSSSSSSSTSTSSTSTSSTSSSSSTSTSSTSSSSSTSSTSSSTSTSTTSSSSSTSTSSTSTSSSSSSTSSTSSSTSSTSSSSTSTLFYKPDIDLDVEPINFSIDMVLNDIQVVEDNIGIDTREEY